MTDKLVHGSATCPPKSEGRRWKREGGDGSPVRYVAGMVSLFGAMVALPAGGIQMVRTLERGGYGTTSIDVALVWLGVGGGLLGIGISLLIWELSVRHNIRH